MDIETKKLGMEERIKSRSKIFSHLSASVLATLFVLVISQFNFHGLKGILIDALFRMHWTKNPHPAIALVAYDDAASARYDGNSKVPAEEVSHLLEVLSEDSPLAVVFLGPVNEKLYSETDLNLLAKGFAKIQNALIGYTDDESLGKNPPPALLHSAKYLPGFVSRDTFSYGADSVSRRVMLSIDSIPTVYLKAAEIYAHSIGNPLFKVNHIERAGDSTQTYINWQGKEGTYPILSTLSVIERKTPKGYFTGKIVLISTLLQAKKGGDHIFTPYSREHFATSSLEGAAHSLGTLLYNNGISRTSPLTNVLFSLLIGVITVNLVLFLSPGRGILFVIGELVLLFAFAALLLFKYDVWINISHPFVIACVSYYLVIPYRLIDEYRKRWHYQEKSELMVQLEQLKSNFLSLVSHDLKTPIARIQGSAELLLSESSALSNAQKKSLDAIVHTTDDLGQYVQTVLDLTRIESAKVPLQRVSKDINAVVREVIDNKKQLAEEKNIQIVSELEPLFSIKFDPKLIRQVLANLVENAIKYSPENTVITLSSKEEDNWIKVSVSDEGAGISQDEQEKVFSKFYRCANTLTQDTKGTGLGLYLVKYFVELHKGFVDLKSEVGKGSKFTIGIPVST